MSHPLRTLLAAGTDPGCGGSEACTVWEPSLRKKNTKLQIQHYRYKINYRYKITDTKLDPRVNFYTE